MTYIGILGGGWKTGIHDVRGYRYEHPWLVVHRASGAVLGCWSREEARTILAKMKSETRTCA